MKIILYTLNVNGTIPDYVSDGGYFPTASELSWPQDLALLGIADDAAVQDAIPSEIALHDYVAGISAGWVDVEGEPFDSAAAASWLWARLLVL